MFTAKNHYLTLILLTVVWNQVLLVHSDDSLNKKYKLVSKIKTDKYYQTPDIDPTEIFNIDVKRLTTSVQSQTSKCRVQPKEIKTSKQFEKFRVGADVSRQKSIYQSLTVLTDQPNGIQSFEILGETILIILRNGTSYFLKNNQEFESSPNKVELGIELLINKNDINKEATINDNFKRFTPRIAKINGNAFVGTPREITYCEPKVNKCTKLSGFNQVDTLFKFYAFHDKTSSKQFLLLITRFTLEIYELTSSASLANHRSYSAQFFGLSKLYIEDILKLPGNKIMILNYFTGLIEVQYEAGALNILIKNKVKPIYQQYGCSHMTQQNQGSYIALECTLTRKSYFILQLVKLESFGQYSAQQPIFFNERLTGIGSNNQIVMAHIFSGVRLYWASNNIDHPYPYDYQKAGSIFLHNAKDAQISELDGRKVIYICTDDQLRVYQLSIVNPSVVCYSLTPIQESYQLTYEYKCQSSERNHICQLRQQFSYSSWQHKQIEFTTTILPLIVSALLVATVGYSLLKLYRKYERDVEQARLKYNTDDNQFGLQSN